MKRYRPDWIRHQEGQIEIIMKEDPAGKWVKWEDVKDIILIPCNCEYESERREGFVSDILRSWICPAHGYKKR